VTGVWRRVVSFAVVLAFPVLVTDSASAQESLTDVLSFLLTNRAVPTGDFERDAAAARATLDTMTRSLLTELSTLPVSSPSPGFVYRLNRDLGTLERASDSFGPFFAERGLTAGAGQVSVGFTMRYASYRHLDGHDLRDGTFVTSGNQFRDEPEPFDIERLTLRLDTRTFTGFVNAGITDRLDVGLAVPFVSVSLGGSRENTYRGQAQVQARGDADASGIGDMAVRAKYRFVDARSAGLAALLEVRLPTGDADNLLGSGEASARALGIASFEVGRGVALDLNAGATWGGLAHEFQYRSAVSVSAAPRVTLVGELLGRRLGGVGEVLTARAPHPTFSGVDTIRLIAVGDSMHNATVLGGVKWNVAGTWLISGNVSRQLGDRGLRPGTVVQIGFDYAWLR
jgi:Putative MetA-pathway of phenol degradation